MGCGREESGAGAVMEERSETTENNKKAPAGSSPAARCAPRSLSFAPVLASPGFPDPAGPFRSHPPPRTASAAASAPPQNHARVPRARTGPVPLQPSLPRPPPAFPRAARTLAVLALAWYSAHACRAHEIPRRPIRAGASRGARARLSLTPGFPAPSALGRRGSLRYAGPTTPPSPPIFFSARAPILTPW